MPNPKMSILTVGSNSYDIEDPRIGDLSDLTTTAKSTVVDAINEAAQGGGGGTSDYTDLSNKPSIEGVTLSGNKTASDLGLAKSTDIPAAATSAPQDLASTAAVGTSSKFAKEDHKHKRPSLSDLGAAPAITEVTVSSAGAVTQALDAGKIYHFTGALTSLTITLNAASGLAQYHFDFDCSSTAPTVTIPNTVTMPSGNSFEANKHYEVDILNNYGAVISWPNS